MNARVSGVLAVLWLGSVAAALAEPVKLISNEFELIRLTDQGVESFPLNERIHSMAMDTRCGQAYAIGHAASGSASIYLVTNIVSGVPQLEEIGETARFYGGLAVIAGELFGFSRGELYKFNFSDPNRPMEAYIGNTHVDRSAGAAYDPISDTLYMASYETDNLYRVNYNTAAATYVGPLGPEVLQLGMDWYDGVLHAAVQNGTSGSLELGTVNPVTGGFTTTDVLPRSAGELATSLVVVPEPTGLVLMLAAGLLARRR